MTSIEPNRSLARMQAVTEATRGTQTPTNLKRSMDYNGRYPAISEYFGCNTFGLAHMREKLPKEAFQSLIKTLEQGKKLPKETTEMIASAIKEWAVSQGVTHFCHWFQPMTGSTAEKHDAFISIQHSYHSELRVIERFTGSQLIQGEPDASSFPSGGMRTTFEARGYTAWDPTSPLFIMEDESGKTLCIPTVFFGYHGQALDNKTPLLRSVEALSNQVCEFLKLIGDVDVKRVSATLGPEQEYFLVDKNFVALRPDLLMTGRTLIGSASARGQQLEDHYFGSIPRRVKAFMEDAERELYKLGIPIKTRHNEVAPSQFEVAPIFEDVNIATDHNVITMEVLKRTALKHGLVCLMHEKPFAGINGSGKHNNWSMCNDKGENLLDPGVTPHQNLRFLAILSVVLKAVHDHADVLRAAIASPGNDHRLGANEAPPAIISVFLGSLLNKILADIESGKATEGTETQIINLGVSKIPDISRDYTDRNRTSPFAFTGNKFEFRAVGSSANVAVPMAILNAAVAQAFAEATARLKAIHKDKARDEAVVELIRQLVLETKAIRFEGNGYSEEWKTEAKKRGLPVLNTTADALEVLKDQASTHFLVEQGVLTREEIQSRYHISVERYNKTIELELETLAELVQTYVIPAFEKQLVTIGSTKASITANSKLGSFYEKRRVDIENTLAGLLESFEEFKSVLAEIRKTQDENARMKLLASKAQPQALCVRAACDKAESVIADEIWPLPKYREMLFANTLS